MIRYSYNATFVEDRKTETVRRLRSGNPLEQGSAISIRSGLLRGTWKVVWAPLYRCEDMDSADQMHVLPSADIRLERVSREPST